MKEQPATGTKCRCGKITIIQGVMTVLDNTPGKEERHTKDACWYSAKVAGKERP